MKLSTRSRYGARLILELALKFNNGPIILKDISVSQEISFKYLGQLIIPLKIAGLVKSARGAHGGYLLAKEPKEIKLAEIIRALEGPISLVDCLEEPDMCPRYKKCAMRVFWEQINSNFYKSFEEITVQDIVDKHNSLNL
ncbi:MAG: Rrf2 family transcriptional regulator [Actinobacteria bacterium]|nr:Rrf2 family transcriptional regulator [Actinomycetota bacterium]